MAFIWSRVGEPLKHSTEPQPAWGRYASRCSRYRVISDWRCLTAEHKAKKIESHLNNLSAEGWEFVALDSITVLGFDLGFYLVLKRASTLSEE